MTITCPGCSTSYAIPSEVLSQAQSVRCVRCHQNWLPREAGKTHADNAIPFEPMGEALINEPQTETVSQPLENMPASEIEAPDQPSSSDISIELVNKLCDPKDQSAQMGGKKPDNALGFLKLETDQDFESAILSAPDPLEKFVSRRNSETVDGIETLGMFPMSGTQFPQIEPASRLFPNIAAALFAVALFGGGLIYKHEIVNAVPDLAGLYNLAGIETNSRGLQFVNVKTSTGTNGDLQQLIVSGEVENFTTGSIKVPKIRLSLRDKYEQEIFAWTTKPQLETLSGGEKTVFRSNLKTPPGEAKDLKVHFEEVPSAD